MYWYLLRNQKGQICLVKTPKSYLPGSYEHDGKIYTTVRQLSITASSRLEKLSNETVQKVVDKAAQGNYEVIRVYINGEGLMKPWRALQL